MRFFSSFLTKQFLKKIFFFFCCLALSGSIFAQEKKEEPTLLIEPSFYHHPISSLIPGAKRTVITAAWIKTGSKNVTAITFLKPTWSTTRKRWMNTFVEGARTTLSQKLSQLHPRWLRDEHDVIQVAIIESDDPLTASTILAPDFAQRFVMVFGPELLIAIPTAHRIYVFSKLASPLATIAPAIRDDYKLSSVPVSLEIFELGKNQLRAIGSLDQ